MSTQFTAKELRYLRDSDFLQTKAAMSDKMVKLMASAERNLRTVVPDHQHCFPQGTLARAGKIAKGENYRHLPYFILDYPRLFSRRQVFAFRTMCWWGQEFSATLHLQGDAWEMYRQRVLEQMPVLRQGDWFLSVHDSPWEYHFKPDNYQPLQSLTEHQLTEHLKSWHFLKISRRLPLTEWGNLSPFAVETFNRAMRVLHD